MLTLPFLDCGLCELAEQRRVVAGGEKRLADQKILECNDIRTARAVGEVAREGDAGWGKDALRQ
jgi:hypothetical protein